MDFTLTDEQQAIADLAAQVLRDRAAPEHLKQVEAGDPLRFDRPLWTTLAESNLLGVCIPEAHGGLGLGPVELCLLLEQIGRAAAPVPALATLGYGAPPVARFGTDAQREALLPGVAAGDLVLTAALVEPLGDPMRPQTEARGSAPGWTLHGTKTCVPAGLAASHVVVPATAAGGHRGLFLVETDGPGVHVERQETITGVPEALLELDAAPATALGPVDADGAALAWTVEHATVACCAVMSGAADAAVRLTAEYTKTREQFDRPIATFQAVGQRAADAFIDTQAIRLTMLHAAWLLGAERPASKEVAIAKFFAAEAGQRVVRAAQHLHGGIGVDRDYPLHRYYLLAKQLELALGGASRQLLALGRLLAAEPVEVG